MSPDPSYECCLQGYIPCGKSCCYGSCTQYTPPNSYLTESKCCPGNQVACSSGCCNGTCERYTYPSGQATDFCCPPGNFPCGSSCCRNGGTCEPFQSPSPEPTYPLPTCCLAGWTVCGYTCCDGRCNEANMCVPATQSPVDCHTLSHSFTNLLTT